MRKLLIPLLLFSSHFTNGQEITKDFTKLLYKEDFNAISASKWPNSLTDDNVFIMQNGGYELFRKSNSSGYYLFSEEKRVFDAGEFNLESSFQKHSNSKQSIGLILMTQQNFTGGLIVEISPKLGYRVQKIGSRGAKPLTGGKDGWVKSKNVSKANNELKIKTYQKVFDLYINGEYEYTFSELEYFKGGIGVFIGPNSKCKVEHLSVHGDDEVELGKTKIKTDKQEEESLAKIIVKLKEKLKEKDKEIYELQKKSFSTPKVVPDTAARRKLREATVRVNKLEGEVSYLQGRLNSDKTELENLRKFKKDLEGGGDGDIVITLSNILDKKTKEYEEEKEKRMLLESENARLKKRVDELDLELKRVSETNILLREVLKSKTNESSPNETKDKEKEEDEKDDEYGDKNDLLEELLKKEREERIKQQEAKKKKEEKDDVVEEEGKEGKDDQIEEEESSKEKRKKRKDKKKKRKDEKTEETDQE